jgi:hypothetical protein
VQAVYHRLVLQRAIGGRVSSRALAAINAANLSQDSLRGLLRPEFHFDDNQIGRSLAYLESQRLAAAEAQRPLGGWQAFGRLSHAAQDFYSHSNYVALWLEQFPAERWPAPGAIDALDARLRHHPRLFTARVYFPFEALCLFPALRPALKPYLPRDSHAWLNLDGPEAGPLFPYSIEAAVQRTADELDQTLAAIGRARGQAAAAAFLDQ